MAVCRLALLRGRIARRRRRLAAGLPRQADTRVSTASPGSSGDAAAAPDGGEDEREPRPAGWWSSSRARRPRAAGRAGLSRAPDPTVLHDHLRHLRHLRQRAFPVTRTSRSTSSRISRRSAFAVSSPSYVAVHVSVPVKSLQELNRLREAQFPASSSIPRAGSDRCFTWRANP